MSAQTITDMLDWIELHLEQPITLPQLAAHFGYSPCYCSAQLRAHLNVPFRIYLTSRRLASAAEALRMTNRRILDIAVQYGFSSHESFAHAFRRAYGRTPSSYRQQFRHGSRKKAIS
ncbi:MAG: helix-turn-helix domain-containing protein [Acutalibacteraceae bacterium]